MNRVHIFSSRQFIMINVDPEEVKLRNPAVGLVGDASDVLRALTPLVARLSVPEVRYHKFTCYIVNCSGDKMSFRLFLISVFSPIVLIVDH